MTILATGYLMEVIMSILEEKRATEEKGQKRKILSRWQ
jgi:hypothetical protein